MPLVTFTLQLKLDQALEAVGELLEATVEKDPRTGWLLQLLTTFSIFDIINHLI